MKKSSNSSGDVQDNSYEPPNFERKFFAAIFSFSVVKTIITVCI